MGDGIVTQRWDFWNGPDDVDRRIKYAAAFRPEYLEYASILLPKMARVEARFLAETRIVLPVGYASGWRPATINESTANAASHSAHLTAEAGDKRDDPLTGAYAWWCLANAEVLQAERLHMEHPIATVIRSYARAKEAAAAGRPHDPMPWCHLTTRAPRSGSRAYFPDATSPKEWKDYVAQGGKAGFTYQQYLELK